LIFSVDQRPSSIPSDQFIVTTGTEIVYNITTVAVTINSYSRYGSSTPTKVAAILGQWSCLKQTRSTFLKNRPFSKSNFSYMLFYPLSNNDWQKKKVLSYFFKKAKN
jgi:hypothetical protein